MSHLRKLEDPCYLHMHMCNRKVTFTLKRPTIVLNNGQHSPAVSMLSIREIAGIDELFLALL